MFADYISFPFSEDSNKTVNITKEKMLIFLDSNDAVLDFANFLILDNPDVNKSDIIDNILNETSSDEGLKAMLVSLFISEKARKNPVSAIRLLVVNYKTGHIKVHEKTMFFRLIDFTPSSIVTGVIESFTKITSDDVSEQIGGGEQKDVAV